jgi:hypothetical protein
MQQTGVVHFKAYAGIRLQGLRKKKNSTPAVVSTSYLRNTNMDLILVRYLYSPQHDL